MQGHVLYVSCHLYSPSEKEKQLEKWVKLFGFFLTSQLTKCLCVNVNVVYVDSRNSSVTVVGATSHLFIYFSQKNAFYSLTRMLF